MRELKPPQQDTGARSAFRTSFTSQEGVGTSEFLEGKVFSVNNVNWTVDVRSSFDQRTFRDVQVAAPYAHYLTGAGFHVMPEVGAKVMVCVPGDTSPPHVAYFLMAFENVDTGAEDAPAGTTDQGATVKRSSGASFAGGRPRAKPGDQMWLGADGNFIKLHRGGVLEIGASELSQRVFIPLSNTVVDISENYYHHTQGGTEYWGLQPGRYEGKSATEYFQTFRVFAEDKFADVRVKCGKVQDTALDQLQKSVSLGQVCYEVLVVPQAVEAETGALVDVKKCVYRFVVDVDGNVSFGAKNELSIYGKKKLFIESDGSVQIKSGAEMSLKASDGITIDGGAYATVRGSVVKLGPGSRPVAHQGALVQVTIPFTPMAGAPVPLVLSGIIITGEPTVRV